VIDADSITVPAQHARRADLAAAIRPHRSAGDRRHGPSGADSVIESFSGLRESDERGPLDVQRFL